VLAVFEAWEEKGMEKMELVILSAVGANATTQSKDLLLAGFSELLNNLLHVHGRKGREGAAERAKIFNGGAQSAITRYLVQCGKRIRVDPAIIDSREIFDIFTARFGHLKCLFLNGCCISSLPHNAHGWCKPQV
jgi:hypothetical protein